MKRKRFIIVKPIRFSIFIAICILISFGFVSIIMTFNRAYSTTYDRYEYIEVVEGDTIWGLTSRLDYEDYDIRKLINDIRKINKMHSYDIHPGDIIKVPIKK